MALRTHQQLECNILGPRRIAQQRGGAEALGHGAAELVGCLFELHLDAEVVGGFLVDLDAALAVPQGERRGACRGLPEGLFYLRGSEGRGWCSGAVEEILAVNVNSRLFWLGKGRGKGERLAVVGGNGAARAGGQGLAACRGD